MYDITSNLPLLDAILIIIMIVVFFVVASKISKILDILTFFRDIELRKPENWFNLKCEKCGHEFRVAKSMKGNINCPDCKAINQIKTEDIVL
jgi:predicted Zn-ribbon and HTH transcriptional regulator